MFVDIQPLVWFGISLACQYPSDLLTVNTVTSESEYQTFLLFQINSESYYDDRMVTTAVGTQYNRMCITGSLSRSF